MDDYVTKPYDAKSLAAASCAMVAPVAVQSSLKPDMASATPVQIGVTWLEIEGIDSNDARGRLSGDFDLFRSMLKHLFAECSDITIPAVEMEAAVLATNGGRMHKLRGSAGMLGAKAIHRLAGEAEAACAAGEADLASDLAASLAALLQRLKECAAPALNTSYANTEEEVASGVELERLQRWKRANADWHRLTRLGP